MEELKGFLIGVAIVDGLLLAFTLGIVIWRLLSVW